MISFFSFLQSIRHQNNFERVQQSYHELRIYQEAAQSLAPLPYALRKRKLYQAAYWFSLAYHPISFVLSLVTAILLAFIFAGLDTNFWQQSTWTTNTWLLLMLGALGFALLVMLFIGVEIAKNHYATEVFKYQDLMNNRERHINKIYLTFLVILSIILSGVGGACVSYLTSDQSEIYRTRLQMQKDSLSRKYEPQLKIIEQAIARLLALQTNTQLRRWGLTEQENKQLLHLQQEKAKLNKAYQQALQQCQSTYQEAIIANIDTTHTYVWLAVLVVFLAEILNIRAYQIRYAYLHKVRAEGLGMGYIQLQEHNNIHTNTNMNANTNTNTTVAVVHKKDKASSVLTKPKSFYKKEKKSSPDSAILSEPQLRLAQKMLDIGMNTRKVAQILGVKPNQIEKIKTEIK